MGIKATQKFEAQASNKQLPPVASIHHPFLNTNQQEIENGLDI